MLCPRCDRARIQRDGVSVRCAVCGMSYDPDQQVQSVQDTAALPSWVSLSQAVPQAQAVPPATAA